MRHDNTQEAHMAWLETASAEGWQPVYRRVWPSLLGSLLDELDVSVSEAARRSGLGETTWARYLSGDEFPDDLEAPARGLGISPSDLGRALVVQCAEDLDLDFLDLGTGNGESEAFDESCIYHHKLTWVLRSLHETLRVTPESCARRAGVTVDAWNGYLRGENFPEHHVPTLAWGLGMDVGELERRIVSKCLEQLGLASTVRTLRPGPAWVTGGVVLDDGRLVTVDSFSKEVWAYERSGSGHRVDALQRAVPGAAVVQRSPEGALWIFGKGKFLELSSGLEPQRSYEVWGRRDAEGRLLRTIRQWGLRSDREAVAVTLDLTGTDEAHVVRLPLHAGGAGTFEKIAALGSVPALERRLFMDASPKIAVGVDETYVLRGRPETMDVVAVTSGEVVASYPGGLRRMEETGRVLNDWFVGLGALGLVAVDGEVLVWRQQERRYWLETLDGQARSQPRRSRSTKWVPVVGHRLVGMVELGNRHFPAGRSVALLRMESQGSRSPD